MSGTCPKCRAPTIEDNFLSWCSDRKCGWSHNSERDFEMHGWQKLECVRQGREEGK